MAEEYWFFKALGKDVEVFSMDIHSIDDEEFVDKVAQRLQLFGVESPVTDAFYDNFETDDLPQRMVISVAPFQEEAARRILAD